MWNVAKCYDEATNNKKRGLKVKKLPKVGDLVKITYFGVITEVRGLPEYEPHFEIDDNCTRHSLGEISEMTIYGDDSPETALMRSFSCPSREF